MTKKRFKFSLAALGLMIAFLLALMGLLLAPTLASADKNSGNGHNNSHSGTGSAHGGSNPIYFQSGNGSDGSHDHRFGGSMEFCVDSNVGCLGVTDKPGTSDDFAGPGGDTGRDFGQSPNGDGQRDGQGNGGPPRFFSGGPFGGGGSPGQPGHDGPGPGGDGPDDTGHGPKIPDLNIDFPGDDTPLPPDFDPPGIPDFPPPGDGPQTFSTVDPEQVPEPLTLSLFTVGLAGTAALRRRRKDNQTGTRW